MHGEAVLCTEVWSCGGKGTERRGPTTHFNEVYITARQELSNPPYMGKHTSCLFCPQKCGQVYKLTGNTPMGKTLNVNPVILDLK